MLNYKDLWLAQVFVDVAKSGSLAQTARNLHYAPSQITEAIGKLEKKVTDPLLVRTARGSHLTELGEQLLPQFQAICQQADTLLETMSALSAPELTEVKIGTLLGAHTELIQSANAKVDDLNLVPVSMEFSAPTPWIWDGRVDMAIVLGPTRDDHLLASVPILTEPRYVLFNRDSLDCPDGTVTFAQIDHFEWPSIGPDQDSTYLYSWLCGDVRGSLPARMGPVVSGMADLFEATRWLQGKNRLIPVTGGLSGLLGFEYAARARIVDVEDWTIRLVAPRENEALAERVGAAFR